MWSNPGGLAWSRVEVALLRFFRVRRQKGFTLIESTVALFVFVAGVMTTVGAMSVSELVGRQAQVRSIAHGLARQKIEELKALDFDSRSVVANEPFEISDKVMEGARQAQAQLELQGTYTVAAVGTGSLHQITVRVLWRNGSSKDFGNQPWSEVILSTLASRQTVQAMPQLPPDQ